MAQTHLSQAEINRIKSLKQITVTINGKPATGYLDESNGLFYDVDEDGVPTGRCAQINKAKRVPPTPPPDEAPNPDDAVEEPEQDAQPKKPLDAAVAFIKAHKLFVAVAAGLAVIALVLFTVVLPLLSSSPEPSSTPTPVPEETAMGDAQPTEYQVIQVTRPVLKGRQISPEDVAQVSIPVSTYQQFSMFGRDLYLWDRAEQLIGHYASKYMEPGHYLEQTDVSVSQPFGVNPWLHAADAAPIVIQVPLDKDTASNLMLTYGSYIDLTIRKTVSSQVAVGQQPNAGQTGEPGTVGDVTHTSTVEESWRTEEYVVSNLTVCDILNRDGHSVYNTFASYCGIPVGERYNYIADALWNDEGLHDRLTPSSILVCVTPEQAQVIGDLNAEGITASIRFGGDFDMTTDAKKDFALEASNVRNTIEKAAADNEQRAADEAAERQKQAEEALRQKEQGK